MTGNQIQKHSGRNICDIPQMAYFHAIPPSNAHLHDSDHSAHQKIRLMTGLPASKMYQDHIL